MKSVILLSAGLDSTVNLYQAVKLGTVRLAITFDYGQRAAERESQSAAKITQQLAVEHLILKLPFFKDFGRSSLLDKRVPLPKALDVEIDNIEKSKRSAKAVWVPNRNGIFLNIAAGFAEALDCDTIIPGFNIEEAATFPDNTQEFMDSCTRSLALSTDNGVRVLCPTVALNKTEIVKLGQGLGVKWSQIWPCYQEFDKWCGQCESCQRARRAFVAAGLKEEFDANAMA